MKDFLATFSLLQRALAFNTDDINFDYDDDQLGDYRDEEHTHRVA